MNLSNINKSSSVSQRKKQFDEWYDKVSKWNLWRDDSTKINTESNSKIKIDDINISNDNVF